MEWVILAFPLQFTYFSIVGMQNPLKEQMPDIERFLFQHS